MILKFNVQELNELANKLNEANEFIINGFELYNEERPFFIKDEVPTRSGNDLPYLEDEVDRSKLKPTLILVKDKGVYLFGNYITNGKKDIVYASGFNPDIDSSWYEASYEVSHDDMLIEIPFDWYEYALSKNPSMEYFQLLLEDDSITLVY